MDYFVAIKNISDYWQVELLIESFKFHNLENKLLVAICGDKNPKLLPNLANHKRKFVCVDPENKYQELYKAYSLLTALENKTISQPFVLMHTDMLLFKPIKDEWEQHIVFHPQEDREDIKKDMDIKGMWLSDDGAIRFKNIPIKFFKQVLKIAEKCSDKKEPALVAWAQTMIYGNLFFELSPQPLEMELLHDNLEAPIIHYKHGLPPVFSKKAYGEIKMADDPMEILLAHNPTSTTDYMHKIINHYKEKATR